MRFRLGLYLLVNRVLGKEQDGRCQSLRATWGAHASRNFFWVFQFQAAFVVSFLLPYAPIAQDPASGFGALGWLGVVIWALGNAGVILADRQLATWRADPANRGRTARHALWSWSRHPNYFFELVTWVGVALVAKSAPWGAVAWAIPAVSFFLLFRVTSIPATERQALRSRDDYAEYQRTRSVLGPLPPTRVAPRARR